MRRAIMPTMPFSDWNPEAVQAVLNNYAPYTGAGVRITHISEDASEIHIEMELTERNANLVGTHFGGSLYAMVDPHLMILLIQRLGPRYVVWDKGATIEFRRPGLGTVRARVHITDEELDAIREAVTGGEKHFPKWTLEILNEQDEVVATVVKTLYVRRAQES